MPQLPAMLSAVMMARSPGEARELRQLSRMARTPADARELVRLTRLPSYQATTTTLFGEPFEIVDAASFLAQYREIVYLGSMDFATDNSAPTVIDGGANVGVVTAYFKRRFPAARIQAFEADPRIAACLSRNVASLQLHDVEVIDAALWNANGELTFHSEGSDAGRLSDCPPEGSHPVTVRSVRLIDSLDQPVDLLKLDIEGAEFAVLVDAESALGNVARIYVEYHSAASTDQELGELLSLLSRNGFRYFVQHETSTRRPFVETHEWNGFDNQLVIFATRAERN